jgi:hypothetical protein
MVNRLKQQANNGKDNKFTSIVLWMVRESKMVRPSFCMTYRRFR